MKADQMLAGLAAIYETRRIFRKVTRHAVSKLVLITGRGHLQSPGSSSV